MFLSEFPSLRQRITPRQSIAIIFSLILSMAGCGQPEAGYQPVGSDFSGGDPELVIQHAKLCHRAVVFVRPTFSLTGRDLVPGTTEVVKTLADFEPSSPVLFHVVDSNANEPWLSEIGTTFLPAIAWFKEGELVRTDKVAYGQTVEDYIEIARELYE